MARHSPPLHPDQPAAVHLIDPGRIPSNLVTCALTPDERDRAARFHFPKDALLWSACRTALRHALADHLGCHPSKVPIEVSPAGKPFTPDIDLHFNLSHSGGLGLLILSHSGPVGIDLEPLSRAPSLLDCVDAFCHPEEIAGLPSSPDARAERLLRIWVRKEALLKAVGTGMSYPPQHLKTLDDRGLASTPLPGIESLHLVALEHPDLTSFLAAAAVPNGVGSLPITPLPLRIDSAPPT